LTEASPTLKECKASKAAGAGAVLQEIEKRATNVYVAAR
jgi:hypothetical protein